MPSAKRKANLYAPLLAVVILLAAWLVVKTCNPATSPAKREDRKEQADQRGLNRHPDRINYSKHAQCRMECRKISQSEVRDILERGTINYKKSELGDRPECRRKYAVEGTTSDGQRVRIIFAPCKQEVTVVTVIDLGREWACDCK